jgi:tRNA:m4X modification enzyme
VDLSSFTGCRQKFDNKVKQRGKVRRLRCDLEHLRLANVEEFANNNTIHMNLVGLCKHLCGVATDFAIKCVENAQKHVQFSSLFLAPCNNWWESKFSTFSFPVKSLRCPLDLNKFGFPRPSCHHRCIYSEYSGRLFLESLDICESDFAALLHVSTWAVCGFSNHKDQPTTSHCDRHDCTICSFTEQDKIELGRRVKLLLELGRADHLIRIGYNVNVIYYVPFTVTPENILIVATLKKL